MLQRLKRSPLREQGWISRLVQIVVKVAIIQSSYILARVCWALKTVEEKVSPWVAHIRGSVGPKRQVKSVKGTTVPLAWKEIRLKFLNFYRIKIAVKHKIALVRMGRIEVVFRTTLLGWYIKGTNWSVELDYLATQITILNSSSRREQLTRPIRLENRVI